MAPQRETLARVPRVLGEAARLPVRRAERAGEADLVLRLGPHLVVVEAKSSSRSEAVAQGVQSVRSAARRVGGKAIPLVAVPYMGEAGRRICRDAGVGFIDLSGNAHIEAPGLRIHVTGQPNRFLRRGRPSSVFAPKSARVARLMLLDPKRWWRQSELAEEGPLGAGYVSRICSRLEEEALIVRNSERAVRPRGPNLLLDAWRSQYDFRRHDIREGHVGVRSGQELVQRVVEACKELGHDYALTGLAAAWLLAPFAGYRLAALYVRQVPSDKLLARLRWHEEKRGANLWLVRPNDEGVFHGVESIQGKSCVSAVQTYLDLKAMPERAEEAAEHLRKERLRWT